MYVINSHEKTTKIHTKVTTYSVHTLKHVMTIIVVGNLSQNNREFDQFGSWILKSLPLSFSLWKLQIKISSIFISNTPQKSEQFLFDGNLIKKTKNIISINISLNEERKGYTSFQRGKKKISNSHTYNRQCFFRIFCVCVNIYDKRLGVLWCTSRKRKVFFIFMRMEVIELCDKYACVYYKQQQRSRICECSWYIPNIHDVHIHKTRSPFFSPARAQHILCERDWKRKRKEVECDFHIWNLACSTDTHRAGKVEKHTQSAGTCACEWKRETRIHKSFPPHSINVSTVSYTHLTLPTIYSV